METTSITRTREDIARLGKEIYASRVKPILEASDLNMYVAIDVDSGAFEKDPSSYEAVARLRRGYPSAHVWLERFGHPAACRM